MYFVVLRLLKVIENRYFLVMNFMVFRDPHFYRFSIDFGRPRGLQKSSLSVPVAFSKKKVLIQRLHLMRKGSKNTSRASQIPLWEPTVSQDHCRNAPWHPFGRFGKGFGWLFIGFCIILGGFRHRFYIHFRHCFRCFGIDFARIVIDFSISVDCFGYRFCVVISIIVSALFYSFSQELEVVRWVVIWMDLDRFLYRCRYNYFDISFVFSSFWVVSGIDLIYIFDTVFVALESILDEL